MESGGARHDRRPPLWPAVLGAVLLTAVLLGFVALLTVWKDIPASSLTRDPVGTAGLRWETGFLYKIGILLWGATTATCLLGGVTWKGVGNAGTLSAFLFASAALTLVFALDDVFQWRGELHDHLGLAEVAVFAIYAAVLCAFAIVFGSTVLRTEYVLLAATGTLFVVWLALRRFGAEFVVQDAVRLMGQVALLLYFLRTSAYGPRRPLLREAPEEGA